MATAFWGTFDEALDAVRRLVATKVIQEILADAVGGDPPATRTYVDAWSELVAVYTSRLPASDTDKQAVATLVGREAISLPFRARFVDDLGVSISIALLSDLRDMTTVVRPLEWPEPRRPDQLHTRFGACDVNKFEWTVDRLLDRKRHAPPLREVIDTFDLSHTDAGRLFGVSRQAASQWLDERVPTERAAKVTTVAQIASLLGHHLQPERIPGLARKHADAYDGFTMLEMIEADRHEELLASTRRSFDWAATA